MVNGLKQVGPETNPTTHGPVVFDLHFNIFEIVPPVGFELMTFQECGRSPTTGPSSILEKYL